MPIDVLRRRPIPQLPAAPLDRARPLGRLANPLAPLGPIPGAAPPPSLGRRANGHGRVALAKIGRHDRALSIARSGEIQIDGRAPSSRQAAIAIYEAARVGAEQRGFYGQLPMNRSRRERALKQLLEVVDRSSRGDTGYFKDKGLAGSTMLLLNLVRDTPKSQSDIRVRALDGVLDALTRTKNTELAGFHLLQLEELRPKMEPAQANKLDALVAKLLPKKSLVEQYTAGRTKPLEVRLSIHPEFWAEELKYFDKKFELVRKNRQDTSREYKARLVDPTGRKPPLDVHIEIKKDELGYLAELGDEDAHVLMYSGHSAVGGNGSEAIRSAPEMAGEFPKMIFAANCRGKDNYAETANAVPEAHLIMTMESTYGDSGQARVEALFDMFARDETYAWMRDKTEVAYWDEPADNYFYPDEWRKFLFSDADSDGLVDFSKLGVDALYDVELAHSGSKFMRALNFTNSELYYHHSVDHDNGQRSHYGKRYADSLVAAGPMRDARPGELVRVTEVEARGPRGGKKTKYVVRFDPKMCRKLDDDVLAGHVTAHTIMNLARLRDGAVKPKEAARAFIMGAQAIHYLHVYTDSYDTTMQKYVRDFGLPEGLTTAQIETIFANHDAHGNDAQVDDFVALLRDQHGLALDDWTPKFRGHDIVVA